MDAHTAIEFKKFLDGGPWPRGLVTSVNPEYTLVMHATKFLDEDIQKTFDMVLSLHDETLEQDGDWMEGKRTAYGTVLEQMRDMFARKVTLTFE